MEAILKTIVEGMVDNKESVKIEKAIEDGKGIYYVTVAESDLGKVIGREGKKARAIRTIMGAIGYSSKKKFDIKFVSEAE